MLWTEQGDRMSVHRGSDGKTLWERVWDEVDEEGKPITYEGPCILHGDTVMTQGQAS